MTTEHESSQQGHVHVVPYAQYILIWLGLLALTGITVALSGVSLGRWIIVCALLIAATKTGLVLNVFMHLSFEDRMFRVFVAIAVVTLTIFLVLTFADYAFH